MTKKELQDRVKKATTTPTTNLDEGYIHDKVIKLMKLIWSKTGDPEVPKDEIPLAVAHLDLNVIKHFTTDKDVISMWDKISDTSKLSMAKVAFGVGASYV